jgi:uncharacterized membrane protein YcaP (DUF421 family)
MVNDLLGWVGDVVAQMNTMEWIIAGVLAAILVVAVVQQLAKTAALIVVLIAVGLFLMNGRVENWSF